MSATLLEESTSHQGTQLLDSTQVDTPRHINLTKLSMNMKNYCGIHLRLLNNLNGESLHSLFMLNPECQIKILEENLNFLNKKNSRYSNFQMKSNYFSLNDSQLISSLTESKQGALPLKPLLKYETGSALKLKIISEVSSGSGANESDAKPNCKPFRGSEQRELCSNHLEAPLPRFKPKIGKQTYIKKRHNSVFLPIAVEEENQLVNGKTDNESDNQFEFTVEQEKIVSFVCSPSPPRKNTNQSRDCLIDSDLESDLQSDMSSSKGDSLSETISSTSGKSKDKVNVLRKDNSTWEQFPKPNNLLWHPPSSQKYLEAPSSNKQYEYCYALPRKINPVESEVNLHNPVGSFGGYKKLKSSFSQETILFREASLRGCYNLENILKDVRPPQQKVEQEVDKVRQLIFSAIRQQRTNDDVVPDCVLAILDICKSWLNLNSHFEREEFKAFLEVCGLESSFLSDFLHWQCVSRTFIDKMINALRRMLAVKQTVCGTSSEFNYCTSSVSSGNQYFDNNGRSQISSLFINDNNLKFDLRESQPNFTLPKSEFNQNKYWKQRRFLSEQQKSGASDAKSKRLCKSKMTVSNASYNNPQLLNNCSAEKIQGQGDGMPVYYNRDAPLGKFNYPLPTNSHIVQGGTNLFSSGYNFAQQNNIGTGLFKNNTLPGIKGVKEFCIVRGETNICPLSPMNDVLCCSTPNILEFPINHGSLTSQTIPTIPPQYYTNPFCYINPNHIQSSLSQSLIKPNPIHCIDTDVTENCVKSSYMKPGSYNPPQKPINCLKVVNNNIPIEDPPVVGIPIIYPNSQSNPQQFKFSHSLANTPQLQLPMESNCVKRSDDTWKAALTLAESFRDSMMHTKAESPNLKLSETVSLKTHFLLSDQTSQHSSNNDFRLDSEAEDLSVPDNPPTGIEIAVVEAQLKTTDWLIKSFNKAVSENEKEKLKNTDSVGEHNGIQRSRKVIKESQFSDEPFSQDEADTSLASCSSLTIQHYDGSENIISNDNPFYQHNTVITQKKSKKHKKFRDDCAPIYQNPPSMLCTKPKSAFKRSVTKQITCKLEDILDCIWKTEVCNLVTEELKSEKEVTRLELKVRSPLYLQAMRCKLTNHSYDTLEQALTDFHQYFVDAKNRNKGDKQCIEVVGALEKIFLSLVEQHFGLLYQPTPQFLSPIGLPPLKTRRSKKTSRRF